MSDTRPYQLAYVPAQNLICVQGPAAKVGQLVTVLGYQAYGDLTQPNSFVTIPANRENVMAVEALSPIYAVGDEYREMRKRYMAPTAEQLMQLRLFYRPQLSDYTLLEHQLEFCAFANVRHGMLNASEQGTGKTATGWTMLDVWRAQRALIVAPQKVGDEWANEYDKMFATKQPFIDCNLVNYGSVATREERIAAITTDYLLTERPTSIIVNYDVLTRLKPAFVQFNPDVIIFDESWKIKGPKAQVTKTAIELSENAHHVMDLTGTPIGNDVGDLYTQLRCVMPEIRFITYKQFLARYCILVNVNAGPRDELKPVGCMDPVGLMQLIHPVWYRATKATSLRLPPKHYERVYFTLPPDTAQLYRRVTEEGESALGDVLSLNGIRTIMLRQHQLAGGIRPVIQNGETVDHEYMQCPKLEWVENFASERLEGDPSIRVIIWCKYNAEVDRITEALKATLGDHRVVSVKGGMKTTEINAIKESVNSRDPDGYQVIVAQIKALAYGHNIQSVDINIYFSMSWSYVEHAQSQDRSHRMGREDAVAYYYLIMRDTVDVEIMSAQDRKEDLAIRLSPPTVSNPIGGCSEKQTYDT